MAKVMRSYKLEDATAEGLVAIAEHHGLVSVVSRFHGTPNATAAIEKLVREELARIARKSRKKTE